jgi:hypothetical protein
MIGSHSRRLSWLSSRPLLPSGLLTIRKITDICDQLLTSLGVLSLDEVGVGIIPGSRQGSGKGAEFAKALRDPPG